MDVIKERNNPDTGLIILLIIASGTNIGIYLWSTPYLFYSSCLITLVICFFLCFRTIEFIVDKDKIKFKLLFLSIPYKIINVDFDTVKMSSLDILTFYKNQVELLSIQYADDIEEPTYTLGSLEILHGQKRFDIGNKKASYNLFQKIRIAVLKYNLLANTYV